MKLRFINFICLFFISHCSLNAGPPFNTDDPEPVDFRHWEFYFASENNFMSGFSTGTLPHFELNYGAVPNVQLHCVIPINYQYLALNTQDGRDFNYGYGYTELGVKYRFIKESDNMPQIGTFPIIEVPTINNKNFSNNKPQIYLPLWLQKSWGKLTTYGGAGYWFNPGTGNKNWLFAGWEAQYDISKTFTLGGELFYKSANTTGGNSFIGLNVGGFVNFSEKFHFIYSVGRNFAAGNTTIAYGGLLWTI